MGALLLLGSPPDIKITEMLVGHQVSGRGRDTKKVQNISVTYVCYLPGSVLAVIVGVVVVVVVVVGVSVVVVADVKYILCQGEFNILLDFTDV